MSRSRILVVDDKPNFLGLFRRILGDEFDVETAPDAAQAMAVLGRQSVDVVVSDVRMPGASGLELLQRIKALHPEVDVILMTAYGAVADAVTAMKAGAYHYLTKPFDPDDAVALIREVVARRERRKGASSRPSITAASASMQAVLELVAQAARSEASALITGEPGTGKELVAREIHARSARSGRAFVPVGCESVSEAVIDAQLFGIVKRESLGAAVSRGGLFHEASGGTIFLDEVTELPGPVQAKLLRALQQRSVRRVGGLEEEPVDTRIVGATSRDIVEAVRTGRLRSDLYSRLNVIAIHVPPLRDRREDIVPLANEFLARMTRTRSAGLVRLSEEAEQVLLAQAWPGNVRQLENAMARASAIAAGTELEAQHLDDVGRGGSQVPAPVPLAELTYREVLAISRDQITREYLVALLTAVRGNVSNAADKAGIERESLYRLLKRYGVRADDFRDK